MKKLIPVLLVIFMLFSTQIALGKGAIKLNANGVMSPAVYKTISDGESEIVNNGDGTISISGSTSTYYAVGEIGLKLNLQYYTSGKWSTLSTYSYSKSDSDYISGGKKLTVSKGYNYRVVAQHTSLDGGVSESGQSYTEAIYVD